MRANKVQWTDQRERVLLELWAAGCTAGTIAAYFGVSREAILAKIYRLRRTAPSLHLAAPARRRRNKRSDRSKDVRKPRRASVLELNNTSCRWPRENRRKSAEIFFLRRYRCEFRGRPAVLRPSYVARVFNAARR